MMKASRCASLASVLALASACNRQTNVGTSEDKQLTHAVKQALLARLDEWIQKTQELKSSAPHAAGRGWDAETDAAALLKMQLLWGEMCTAYERVEGAVAPLFPEADFKTDSRYHHFLKRLGASGDAYAFDAQGVTGSHAIERILYAPSVSKQVLDYEKNLPGYRPAAFPNNAQEARDFSEKLVTGMLNDQQNLRDSFASLELDAAFVARSLDGLVHEAREKLEDAAHGTEEARYANTSLRDLRANLRGIADFYALMQSRVKAKPGGDVIDGKVQAAMKRVGAACNAVTGDALPPVPANFSEAQTPQALATPFGKLHTLVLRETDPKQTDSLAQALRNASHHLGLPLPAEDEHES